MSLINEALKKAQKLRSGDPAGTVAPMPGGGSRVTKHSAPRSTQQLVLMAAGGVALVVLSVVATFWFVNRAPAPKTAPKPSAAKPVDTSAPAPAIVAPLIKPPVVAAETPPPKSATPPAAVEKTRPAATPAPAPAPPVIPTATTEKPAVASAATPAPETVATTNSPPPPTTAPATPPPAATAAAPAAAAPAATDPRVHAFIDAIKVMGIRSSGGDSRVLMNDRVFRVNDIVERNLGIRLTGVAPDALTFTDSNGAIYVKNF